MELKPDLTKASEAIKSSIDQKAFRIDKQKETDQKRMELKPDFEKSTEAIERTIGEKAFQIEKQKNRDSDRMELQTDVKGIGSLIEGKIEKIEQKKKDDNTS
jgi:hypothetical protein